MAGNEEILRNVKAQLRSDTRIDESRVNVEVEDSRVILSGVVQNLAALNSAEDAARSVEGVRRVENRLKIEYPGYSRRITDEKVAESLRSALALDRNINTDFVRVYVDEGMVTLRGSVDSFWGKERCAEIASEIDGVLQVINELTVVPTHNVSDDQIATEISDVLDRMNMLDLEAVTVKVEQGVVTLSGKVPHWNSYYSAEYAAKNTRGVKNVINELILA